VSVCDACPEPGHCCRAIVLGGGSFAREAASLENAERTIRAASDVLGPPMPFHPLFKRQDGAWVWWCPNLNAKSGRCDDYANRPFCCSHYEPGTDRLCVLHKPTGQLADLVAECEALEGAN
jgi:Fe-S-cluster containining protein